MLWSDKRQHAGKRPDPHPDDEDDGHDQGFDGAQAVEDRTGQVVDRQTDRDGVAPAIAKRQRQAQEGADAGRRCQSVTTGLPG